MGSLKVPILELSNLVLDMILTIQFSTCLMSTLRFLPSIEFSFQKKESKDDQFP